MILIQGMMYIVYVCVLYIIVLCGNSWRPDLQEKQSTSEAQSYQGNEDDSYQSNRQDRNTPHNNTNQDTTCDIAAVESVPTVNWDIPSGPSPCRPRQYYVEIIGLYGGWQNSANCNTNLWENRLFHKISNRSEKSQAWQGDCLDH